MAKSEKQRIHLERLAKLNKGNLYLLGKKRGPSPLRGRKRPPFSEEWKAKIAKSKTGKKCSPESRAKMSQSRIGKKHSLETKEKMRESAIRAGTGMWNKERVMSEETRKKLDWTGRKHTEETKQKIRAKALGRRRPDISGCNHYNWKNGGVQNITVRIRGLYQYRQWRSDVFTRDNFTCVFCGKYGGSLEADHIKPFSILLRENNIVSLDDAIKCAILWDINNGRTVCRPCHVKTDTYGNKVNKKNQ